MLGTEATERNSTTCNEEDALRLREAREFAGDVETVTQLHLDTRKTEGPEAFLAKTEEEKTRDICEKLTERPLRDDDWTRMKLPTSLGGMGIRAVTSQLVTQR